MNKANASTRYAFDASGCEEYPTFLVCSEASIKTILGDHAADAACCEF
jgi:hypothetical protein